MVAMMDGQDSKNNRSKEEANTWIEQAFYKDQWS